MDILWFEDQGLYKCVLHTSIKAVGYIFEVIFDKPYRWGELVGAEYRLVREVHMANSVIPHSQPSKRYRTFILFLLTLVYGFNFIDRQIVGILAPFIQADLDLTNTQLGLLIGLAFAVFYTVMGIPIAYLADRVNRVTLLSIALAIWSGFTALTGLAQNFTHIALARIGVGVGEAGGSPPAHSIISDLYDKRERTSALGVYSMGIPLGIMTAYFVTAALTGADTDTVNWRRIFIILGLTGIGLAVIVKILVPEPERGAMEKAEKAAMMARGENVIEEAEKLPFFEAVKQLLSIKTWWFMCLGIAFASFSSYAFSGFQTKLILLIDPDYDFKKIIIILGFINGIAYAGATFLGAKAADIWGSKNVRGYAFLPALAVMLALPLSLGSLWSTTIAAHLTFSAFLLVCLGCYLGPSFAIAQTLAPVSVRATSTALFFFVLNMIALGGGPTFAGIMIDVFAPSNTEVFSVRMGMSSVVLSFLLSGVFFWLASRSLPEDWKRAEERNG